jgi:hypothetical protein
MTRRKKAAIILGAGAVAGLAYYLNAQEKKRAVKSQEVFCAGIKGAIQEAVSLGGSAPSLSGTLGDLAIQGLRATLFESGNGHVSLDRKQQILFKNEQGARSFSDKNIKDADFTIISDETENEEDPDKE